MKKLLLVLLLSPSLSHASCKELLAIYKSSVAFSKENVTIDEALGYAFDNYSGDYQTWRVLENTIQRAYYDVLNKTKNGESKFTAFCTGNIKFREEGGANEGKSKFTNVEQLTWNI